MDKFIELLPKNVQSHLRSGVTIISFTQCVTELVQNSLDARSTAIAVRLDLPNYKVQIVDNGMGITKDNLDKIGPRYMTSKCHSVADLFKLKSYGFRGEALSSILVLCERVNIISRAGKQTTFIKVFNQGIGEPIYEDDRERPSSGTTVTIYNFMHSLPVRQKALNEVLEIQNLTNELKAIALIHPSVSFTLRNDKNRTLIMQTCKEGIIPKRFQNLFPEEENMFLCLVREDGNNMRINGFFGSRLSRNKGLQFVYVNKQLVKSIKLKKIINKYLDIYLLKDDNERQQKLITQQAQESGNFLNFSLPSQEDTFHVFIINIICPRTEYDISFNPQKDIVEFKNWNVISDGLNELIMKLVPKKSTPKVAATVVAPPIENVNVIIKDKPECEEFRTSQMENVIKGYPARRRRIGVTVEKYEELTGKKKQLSKAEPPAKEVAKETIVSPDPIFKVPAIPKLRSNRKTKKPIFEPTTRIKENVNKLHNQLNKIKRKYETKIRSAQTVKSNDSMVNIRLLKEQKRELKRLKKLKKHKRSNAVNRMKANEEVVPPYKSKLDMPCLLRIEQLVDKKGSSSRFEHLNSELDYLRKKLRLVCENQLHLDNVIHQNLDNVQNTRHRKNDDLARSGIYNSSIEVNDISTFQNRHNNTDSNYKNLARGNLNSGKLIYCQNYVNNLPEDSIENKNLSYLSNITTESNTRTLAVKNTGKWGQQVQEVSRVSTKGILKRNYVHRNCGGMRWGKNEMSDDSGNGENYVKTSKKLCIQSSSNINNFTFTKIEREISNDLLATYDSNLEKNLEIANQLKEINKHNSENRMHRHRALKEFDKSPYFFDSSRNSKSSLAIKFPKFYEGSTSSSQPFEKLESDFFSNNERDRSNSKKSFEIFNNSANASFIKEIDDLFSNNTEMSSNLQLLDRVTKFLEEPESAATIYETLKKTIASSTPKMSQNQKTNKTSQNDLLNIKLSPILKENLKRKTEVEDEVFEKSEENQNENKEDKNNETWLKKCDSDGKLFYVNIKTGFSSYEKPEKQENKFEITKRMNFLPKGMSPLIHKGSNVPLCNLTPNSKLAIKNIMDETVLNINKLSNAKWSESKKISKETINLMNDLNLKADKMMDYCEPTIRNITDNRHLNIRTIRVLQQVAFNKDVFRGIEMIGQMDKKFIVCVVINGVKGFKSQKEGTKMLILFDQHAVHERIRVEKLYKDYHSADDILSYTTLKEVIILSVTQAEYEFFEEFPEKFENLGLRWKLLENNEIKVTAVPSCIYCKIMKDYVEDSKTFLLTLIREQCNAIIATKGVGVTMPKTLQNVINSEACSNAIKFGDALSKSRCAALVQELALCDLPFICAHGRPSVAPLVDLLQLPPPARMKKIIFQNITNATEKLKRF